MEGKKVDLQEVIKKIPGLQLGGLEETAEFIENFGKENRTSRTDKLARHFLVTRKYLPALAKEDPSIKIPIYSFVDSVLTEVHTALNQYTPEEIKVALATYLRVVQRTDVKENRFNPEKVQL